MSEAAPRRSQKQRARAISRVLWVVLVLNLAVAAAKLAVGFTISSLAMIADGFHSLLDGTSNVIGLVGVHLANRPPDENHHYGHQKYEAFAALGISLLLGITALEVVQAGVDRLLGDGRPLPTVVGIVVMAVTMGVNYTVTRYEQRRGRELQSSILLADSAHTRSDIFVSLSVIAGLAAVWMGIYWLDVIVAFLIAGLIIYIAYGVLRRTTFELTDTAVLSPEEIEEEVMGVPEVVSATNIRSRGAPPNVFIDLEIQLDPDFPLWKAHRIAHVVMDRCRHRFQAADVIVHAEPATVDHYRAHREWQARQAAALGMPDRAGTPGPPGARQPPEAPSSPAGSDAEPSA